jgi:TolA-binding protein
MNKTTLQLTSLVMTFVALLFLAEVRGALNGEKEHKELAEFWKKRVAREQLKKLIAMGKFADFKQDVALLIPKELKEEKVEAEKQKLRNLASVIPHEGTHEITLGRTAKKMLEEGKAQVKTRNFAEGVKTLQMLIDKFPDSYHIVEAHYLIMESYSQQKKNINVIEWVDKMVELFPENRLTGYALLRVGGLYEIDGRAEDAIRIYRTIVAVYQDKKLITQAQEAVSKLEL